MSKRKNIRILDTSVFLTNYKAIYAYDRDDIIIPIKILEELDKHKIRSNGIGYNARKIIAVLDELRMHGNLAHGVRLAKNQGMVRTAKFAADFLPSGLDVNIPDNQILAAALAEMARSEKRKVIVVTRDIQMRVMCDALDILCENYISDQAVETEDQLYTGVASCVVDDELIDRFYAGESVYLDAKQFLLYPNQFVILISSANEKKSALARFPGRDPGGSDKPLMLIKKRKCKQTGIESRNKEQTFAMDLLFDDNVNIVTFTGKAGSGKTICSLGSALEQVMSGNYRRLIVLRSITPVGKRNDIGFLPGSAKEKLLPWTQSISDNLENLLGDRMTLEDCISRGQIEVEALAFIRGRSIDNAFIIIEEAQNMTLHELKTVITRLGNNSKVVLLGDIYQIDHELLDTTTNGLTHVVERFKNYNISGHVTLIRGERSVLATLAAEIL